MPASLLSAPDLLSQRVQHSSPSSGAAVPESPLEEGNSIAANGCAARAVAKQRQRLPGGSSLVQVDFPNPLILSELNVSS